MSLFPNESQSFPDQPEGQSEPGDYDPLPPLPANAFDMSPQVVDETTPHPDISEPQMIPSSQHAAPVMPVMPAVPDQLEQAAGFTVEAATPEAEWSEPPREIRAPDKESTLLNYALAKRHGGKLLRFVIFETIALVALLVFAKLEVQERFSGNSLTYLYGTVMFIAAIACALIPVIFYALPPRLPPAPPREM